MLCDIYKREEYYRTKCDDLEQENKELKQQIIILIENRNEKN